MYIVLHVSTYFLQVNLIIYFILVCVVMVQVSYIPRCRVMLDLQYLTSGPSALGCVNHASPYTSVCNLYVNYVT